MIKNKNEKITVMKNKMVNGFFLIEGEKKF